MDVAAWLRDLGLERYEQAFRENEIHAEILPKLTADDLKDMGVTIVGHRPSPSKRWPPWPSLLWRLKQNRAPQLRPQPQCSLGRPSGAS